MAIKDGDDDVKPPVVGLKRPHTNGDKQNEASRSSSPIAKSVKREAEEGEIEVDNNKCAKREEGEVVEENGNRDAKHDRDRKYRDSSNNSRSRSRSRSGSRSHSRSSAGSLDRRRRDFDDPQGADRKRFDGEEKQRGKGPKRGRFYHRKKGYEYKGAYEDRDNPEVWPEEIDPFAAELAKAQQRLGLPVTGSAAASTSEAAAEKKEEVDQEEEESGDEDVSKYDLYADERSDGEIPSD